MKRLLVIIMLLVVLTGCSGNKGPVKYAAVLINKSDNTAYLCLSDKEGNSIYEKKIEVPEGVYFGEEAVYYTLNGNDYVSVSYSDFKKGDTFNAEGMVLYHLKNGYTYAVKESDITCYYGDKQTVLKNVYNMQGIEGKVYIFYMNNTLEVRDASNNEVLAVVTLPVGEIIGMVKVGTDVYYVNDKGYTIFKDNELGYTIIYPIQFEEILGAKGDHITVFENDEIAAYTVSISNYRMVLTPDYEDESYDGVDFKKKYSKLYEKGYEVYYYQAY